MYKYTYNNLNYHSKQIFLPFHWPRDHHLQMTACLVCSCATSSNCVWLQIIFCSCVKETTPFSFLLSLLGENGSFPRIFIKKQPRWLNDKTIIELGYLKISWYVSVSQINYLPKPKAARNTDKSWYFAQPRPIIVNCDIILGDRNKYHVTIIAQ